MSVTYATLGLWSAWERAAVPCSCCRPSSCVQGGLACGETGRALAGLACDPYRKDGAAKGIVKGLTAHTWLSFALKV